MNSPTPQAAPVAFPNAEISWNCAKAYRGEQRGQVLIVWVEENEINDLADAMACRTCVREIFHYAARDRLGEDFVWLHGEDGARQLARALLADTVGDPDVVQAHCRRFAYDVLIHLPASWTMTPQQVRDFVSANIFHLSAR